MTDEIALKNCPFCGGKAKLTTVRRGKYTREGITGRACARSAMPVAHWCKMTLKSQLTSGTPRL